MFKRKPPPVSAPTLRHTLDGDDSVVTFESGGRPQPLTGWTALRPAMAGALTDALATAEAESAASDGRPLVIAQEAALRLHPAYVAGLGAAGAEALGLPPATTLALDLRAEGRIDQDAFRIRTRWVRPGGAPAAARAQGAMLSVDGGLRRIPEPLWSLHHAASALAAPLDKVARFKALADLRAHWPEDARTKLDVEPYLSDLRVHYASALSLKLGRGGPFDFDPVLFGPRAAADLTEGEAALDEDADSVLTPSAQRLFAEDRFRRERDVRPVYVLRDGEYVFVDPALRPVLGAVRQLQDAPEADRRSFVLNPRTVLSERLGGGVADEIGLENLFVETEQYSARVAGVDVWRAPVLPWLGPAQKNGWLPERFGLKVGETFAVLPIRNIEPVLASVHAARDEGRSTASVEGLLEPFENGAAAPQVLPVTEQTLAALETLRPFAEAQEQADGCEEPRAAFEAATRGKLFLVVKENLDEVEYAPLSPVQDADAATPAIEPNARLRTTLKPHQVSGLNWLAALSRSGAPGGLLADDMGLGKTLQALAFMAWLQEQADAGHRERAPFLIVAPTGLLGNWRKEIEQHLRAPGLGAVVPAFGANLKALRDEEGWGARDIETGRAALRAEAWQDAGVVLTTYETLRDYHFSFAHTRFGLVVFDEVQKLKNPVSQLTRAAKTLNSAFTLGMTGTPVENRLQDLWSIMDVTAPGGLGSSREFERVHPAGDVQALSRLKAKLIEPHADRPPSLLRRLKADALDAMPAKHVHAKAINMPPVQAAAYRDLVVRAAAGAASGAAQGGMLSTLALMRGVSLHPTDPADAGADPEAYAQDSARLSWTLDILAEVAAKREKALIFVESLAMQARLASLIQTRFQLPHAPSRINGEVPGPKRQALVDRFQAEPDRFDVMILSPKTGGVGLTLTAANHVVHLSRWWNPAVEDQATDRVFRIGQTRDVHVYLPLAVHPDPDLREASFDLRLDALIARKRQLTRDLFLPPEASDSDLSDLFREVALAAPAPDPMIDETDAGPLTPQPSISQSARRPLLSLPKQSAEQLGAKIWRVPAGKPRPTNEVVALFAGKVVQHIRIDDPYALAAVESRAAQVHFIDLLTRAAKSVNAVTLTYAPEAKADVYEVEQRRDFGRRWSDSFGGSGPRLKLTSRSKRGGDFHDRSIELDIVHAGGAVRTHSLLLGRGAEAFFNEFRECTVIYAPPVMH